LDAALIALIATVFGGVGLKVVEHWLGRAKVRNEESILQHRELREEIMALKKELRETEQALDTWREKYYDLLDQFIRMKNELQKIG
jgi:uncharacterized coiled-coil DUF342 family protein